MRNNYEMPEVFELGGIKEQILGTKPLPVECDAILGCPYRTEPLPDDIDESDE